MKSIMPLGIVVSLGFLAGPASAGLVPPTATYQSTALAGGVFDYKITLSNSAANNTNIGTFWFAWTPGKISWTSPR